MEKIKIQSSWDDFCPQNYRLAELLKKYKIPAIFFIECDKLEKIKQIKDLANMGFEIGCHTRTHPADLKRLTKEQLSDEIISPRILLQANTGQSIDWFCYPKGKYDNRVKGIVEEAGYKFARTTKVEIPWSFDPLEIFTSWHCYNRKEYHGKPWLKYAKYWLKFIDNNFKKGTEASEIHFWGHAWEIDKYDDWDNLEKLFKLINKKYL